MKVFTKTVTDHAVLRYIERVMGIDVEAIRAEIQGKVEQGINLGATSVRTGTTTYRIKDQTVVTTIEKISPKGKRRGRHVEDEDHGF